MFLNLSLHHKKLLNMLLSEYKDILPSEALTVYNILPHGDKNG